MSSHPLASWPAAALLPMLCLGGLLALGLHALLRFIATRQRAAGHLAHCVAWMLLWSFGLRGDAWLTPTWRDALTSMATAGVFAAAGLSTLSYLNVQATVRRPWQTALQALAVMNVAAAMFAFVGPGAIGRMAGWAAGLALLIVALGIGAWLLLHGYRPARFHVPAFALLYAGASVHLAQAAGLAPANAFTASAFEIASALAVLLLTQGLADSRDTSQAAQLATERRERQTQEALVGGLESELEERTHALAAANRRLHELSITDELTGAFNRRHFNDFCAQVFELQPRHEPLAFCVFDLDHFKSFNDVLGHRAGDQALRAVAGAVRAELRRSGDLLFRLGGEEFGLLFTASSPESAQQFVERIRQSIRELRIHHPGNPTGIVTASFGVAWWGLPAGNGLTRDDLYAQADELLHGAKCAGRDRVELQVV